jgi:hypothetical protein
LFSDCSAFGGAFLPLFYLSLLWEIICLFFRIYLFDFSDIFLYFICSCSACGGRFVPFFSPAFAGDCLFIFSIYLFGFLLFFYVLSVPVPPATDILLLFVSAFEEDYLIGFYVFTIVLDMTFFVVVLFF